MLVNFTYFRARSICTLLASCYISAMWRRCRSRRGREKTRVMAWSCWWLKRLQWCSTYGRRRRMAQLLRVLEGLSMGPYSLEARWDNKTQNMLFSGLWDNKVPGRRYGSTTYLSGMVVRNQRIAILGLAMPTRRYAVNAVDYTAGPLAPVYMCSFSFAQIELWLAPTHPAPLQDFLFAWRLLTFVGAWVWLCF